MKSIVAIFIISFAALFSGCKKTDTVPECLQSEIEEFTNYSCENGASVNEYKFQGELVYVFNYGFCGADLPGGVIDRNCNPIGSLGGFTGNTQVRGDDFSTAIYIRTIWSR